jgi:hypothetical protein
MITFNVVKDEHGWAIRMGERMSTPFRSRDLAIREANCLADQIRCHGEYTEVIVEGAGPSDSLKRLRRAGATRPSATLTGRWPGSH